METQVKPRPTKPTLARVEAKPSAVGAEALAASIVRIEAILAVREAFQGRVEIRLDDAQGFIVDGPGRRVESPGGAADCRFFIAPKDLERLAKGAIDPRQAILFGQIQVQAGPVRAVVGFCDWLVGAVFTERLDTNRRLPSPTRDHAQAREDLEVFGYALVAGALSPDDVKALRARLVDQAQGETDAGVAVMNESAQRVNTLLNKGRIFHDVLLHPLIEAFVPDMLGDHPILKSITASIALPGNASSTMHLDQAYVQPAVPQFAIGLNILWFLDDVSEANGGTRVMPGSHKGGIAPSDPFDTAGTVAAAGPAGTALLLDSRVWHAVGHNVTDRRRHLLITYFNRAFMRPGENYFLSLKPGLEDTFDERVRIMLGYRCTASLGAVDGPVEGKMNVRLTNPIGELSAREPLAG